MQKGMFTQKARTHTLSYKRTLTRTLSLSQVNHSLSFAWQININEDYYVTAVHPRDNKKPHLSHSVAPSF